MFSMRIMGRPGSVSYEIVQIVQIHLGANRELPLNISGALPPKLPSVLPPKLPGANPQKLPGALPPKLPGALPKNLPPPSVGAPHTAGFTELYFTPLVP